MVVLKVLILSTNRLDYFFSVPLKMTSRDPVFGFYLTGMDSCESQRKACRFQPHCVSGVSEKQLVSLMLCVVEQNLCLKLIVCAFT